MMKEQQHMRVPTQLLPVCPRCGKPMTMNLRSDHTFVEDEGWHKAAERYQNFLRTHRGRNLFLEIGVGFNTPLLYALRYKTEDKKSKKTQETVYRYKSYKGVNLGRCA